MFRLHIFWRLSPVALEELTITEEAGATTCMEKAQSTWTHGLIQLSHLSLFLSFLYSIWCISFGKQH